jgi:hypothetical protein
VTTASTYALTVESPFGQQRRVLELILANGMLTGRLVTGDGNAELTGGKATQDEISFFTKIKTPMGRMKAQVMATITGETLTGAAETTLGRVAIHGTRIQN